MKNFFLLTITFIAPCVLLAEGHHGDGEIPWKMLAVQVLNVGVLFGILYYALSQKVKDFFAARHAHLTASIKAAKEQKEAATLKHLEIQRKVNEFEQSKAKARADAEGEAHQAVKKLEEESKRLAAIVVKEAQAAAETELLKAKRELYEELLGSAVTGARGLLEKSVAEPDQRRLQKEFVDKIGVTQ